MSTKSITSLKKRRIRRGGISSRTDKIQIGAMMFPSLLFLAVFSIYPILWVLRYMFFDYNGIQVGDFVGLKNFIRVFHDGVYWRSVLNTLVYASGKILLTLPIAFILALILNEGIKRGKGVVRALIFMPTIISTAVVSMMFYYILNEYNGSLNDILMSLHLVKEPVKWLSDHAMLSAILVAAWGALGNYMIYFLAGLQSIPKEVYESAAVDGANKIQTIIHITIPMLAPVMQMIIMLFITVSFKGYESIMVLTGGGPANATNVMFLHVYRVFFPDGGADVIQYGYGSAVAFVSAVIVGIITVVYVKWSNKAAEI